MDTTETYIKMCEQATEIQKHDFEEGDYHGLLQDGSWSAHNYCEEDGFVGINPQKLIWLPRQEDLQEMVELTGYRFTFCETFTKTEPKHFIWEGERHIGQWYVKGNSMEQLWLAFVMKEKYQKVWNGTDWVKEGKND